MGFSLNCLNCYIDKLIFMLLALIRFDRSWQFDIFCNFNFIILCQQSYKAVRIISFGIKYILVQKIGIFDIYFTFQIYRSTCSLWLIMFRARIQCRWNFETWIAWCCYATSYTYMKVELKFASRLYNRDYPKKFVTNILSEVKFTKRNKALIKQRSTPKVKILYFVTNYNPAVPNLKGV